MDNYGGERCEKLKSRCSENFCAGGGKCIDNGVSFLLIDS